MLCASHLGACPPLPCAPGATYRLRWPSVGRGGAFNGHFLYQLYIFNIPRRRYDGICRLESRRTRKAGRSRGQSAHDRRLSFPPPSGVSRHVAPAVRMLQMHPTSLSRARVSVRQPSQPATAQLFESCSVRKRALFFAHDGAPRGAWCSGHRLARAEWLRRGSVQLVRPAFRPAPTHSCTRASSAPF